MPGRQYGLSDGTRINLPAILLEAFERGRSPTWDGRGRSWRKGVGHAYQQARRVYSELLGSLWAHGPIEEGREVFHGVLEYRYYVADVMGLANAVDSLVALARVAGQQYSWVQIRAALHDSYATAPQLRAQLLEAPKFRNDDPEADAVAGRVRDLCLKCGQRRRAG